MMKSNLFNSARNYRLLVFIKAVLVTAAMAANFHATANDYPDRAITLVVPYAPGGGVDAVGRLLALELQKQLKQTVVVENRAGGGSGIGAAQVARAPADGYTLLIGDPALVTNPRLLKTFPLKFEKDLLPVSMLTASPLVLSVPVTSPVKSVQELIALSKASPAGLSFSSAGSGSTPHLAGEMLRSLSKGNFIHIPYKGSGPAMIDLVGGRIDTAFATQAASSALVKSGKLRALATTGEDRKMSEFPDLPTLSESLPGFRMVFWTGLFAPVGTPPEVLKKLNEAVRASWQTTAVQAALRSAGDRPSYVSTDLSVAFLKSENDAFGTLIRDTKIQVD